MKKTLYTTISLLILIVSLGILNRPTYAVSTSVNGTISRDFYVKIVWQGWPWQVSRCLNGTYNGQTVVGVKEGWAQNTCKYKFANVNSGTRSTFNGGFKIFTNYYVNQTITIPTDYWLTCYWWVDFLYYPNGKIIMKNR
jgi:hypothetical protein